MIIVSYRADLWCDGCGVCLAGASCGDAAYIPGITEELFRILLGAKWVSDGNQHFCPKCQISLFDAETLSHGELII